MESGQAATSGTPPTKADFVQQVLARQQERLNPKAAEAKEPKETNQPAVDAEEGNAEEPSPEAVEDVEGEEPEADGDQVEEVEEEGPEAETITYKVNGKPITISLQEAQDQLASAHELKRLKSEIVENAQRTRQEREQLVQQQTAYAQGLQEIEKFRASFLPSEAQMQQMLANGNQKDYLMAKDMHEKHAKLRQEAERAQVLAQAEQEKALAEQARIMVSEVQNANPAFQKQETWEKVATFAKKLGFEANEVGNWVDSRIWLALESFMRLQEQTTNASKAAKKVLQNAKPLKPAARVVTENSESKRIADLSAAMRNKPSVSTGVELLKTRLNQRMQG